MFLPRFALTLTCIELILHKLGRYSSSDICNVTFSFKLRFSSYLTFYFLLREKKVTKESTPITE
jgi:hypothetical protein